VACLGRQRSNCSGSRKTTSWPGGSGLGINAFSSTTNSRETIMRIRGSLGCYIDGLEAPGGSAIISVGLIVMPDGTGTTVTVDPFNNSEASWLYYNNFLVAYEEYVTDVVDCPGMTFFRQEIDVKAMRILRPGQELQFVITNTTVDNAVNVNLRAQMRVLFGD